MPECGLNSGFLKVSSITIRYRGKSQASGSPLALLSLPRPPLLGNGSGTTDDYRKRTPWWQFLGRHHREKEHRRPGAKVGQDTTPSATFFSMEEDSWGQQQKKVAALLSPPPPVRSPCHYKV